MITTDHLTEESHSKYGHTSSLHRQSYLSPMGGEESGQIFPVFLSGSRPNAPSAQFHRFSPITDELSNQGVITSNNFVFSTTDTITTATYIPQWNPSKSVLVGNVSSFAQAIGTLVWASSIDTTSPDEDLQTLSGGVLLSEQALSYCSRHRIFQHLVRAVKLAQESFSDLCNIEVKTESDPETEDEWLAILVHVRGEVNVILDEYDAYTRKFIKAIPWLAQDRIRLIYDVI